MCRKTCSLVLALFLALALLPMEAQWVMVGRAAKNRIQQLTQTSDNGGGSDTASVILEAPPDRVYAKAIAVLKANPEMKITKDDAKKGKIQFRKGQTVAGLQISPLGDNATQLLIPTSVAQGEPSATSLAVDAVLRICKEVNVECTVQE